jgi:predicted lipid-binding transport protein (Tim44 family)
VQLPDSGTAIGISGKLEGRAMIAKFFSSISFDLAILLLVVLACALWEHHEASKYKAAAQIYQAAQKTNMETIATLQKVGAQNAKAAAQQQKAGNAALVGANSFSSFQQLQPPAAATKLKVIYVSDPTARARASTVLPASINSILHANAGY